MQEQAFRHYMGAVKALDNGTDYGRGYQYGLRRHYHGERFGEDARIALMLSKGGDLAEGVNDGLDGRAPRALGDAEPERVTLDLTEAGLSEGRLLAGPGPLPEGATLLGTVRLDTRHGALVRLRNGVYVQWSAGTVRTLDQTAIRRALDMDEAAGRG